MEKDQILNSYFRTNKHKNNLHSNRYIRAIKRHKIDKKLTVQNHRWSYFNRSINCRSQHKIYQPSGWNAIHSQTSTLPRWQGHVYNFFPRTNRWNSRSIPTQTISHSTAIYAKSKTKQHHCQTTNQHNNSIQRICRRIQKLEGKKQRPHLQEDIWNTIKVYSNQMEPHTRMKNQTSEREWWNSTILSHPQHY